MRKPPEPSTGARKLLVALLDGPGTFYQICERLDIDIESNRAEFIQRELFNRLVEGGQPSHGARCAARNSDGSMKPLTSRQPPQLASVRGKRRTRSSLNFEISNGVPGYLLRENFRIGFQIGVRGFDRCIVDAENRSFVLGEDGRLYAVATYLHLNDANFAFSSALKAHKSSNYVNKRAA